MKVVDLQERRTAQGFGKNGLPYAIEDSGSGTSIAVDRTVSIMALLNSIHWFGSVE